MAIVLRGSDTSTFSSSVSVGGTVTYDDVKEIDSVGIITARSGIRVTSGNSGFGIASPAEKIDVAGTIQSDTGLKVAGHPVVGYGNLGGGEYAARLGSTGSSTLNKTQIYARGALVATFDGASGDVGIGTSNPVGNLEVRGSKSNLIVAKDGLTVKSNSEIATQYDLIQLGAGGALASYSTATATADTQLVHNAYRHSGGAQKYRYADTATRILMNSPGGVFRFENAGSGSADADITFTERLRIDSSGRVKIGPISDYTAGVTNAPVYISMQSDLDSIDGQEAAATNGLVRIEDTGSNDGRNIGIELRNKNSGDIRFFNQDQSTSDRGDLLLVMPDQDTNDGLHLKMRVNSMKSSIQISGKGGAIAGNSTENHTDIYIATKTGVTAVGTGAGAEVSGIIRFEDKGSDNNRYHGIELRNRNYGDVRILNLDEGANNKASMVFAVDNGSTLVEAMRITSAAKLLLPTGSPGIQFGSPDSSGNITSQTLDDYEEGTWTPTVSNLTIGNGTIAGHYTKIGHIVHLSFRLDGGSTTSFTGNMNGISGFPFTAAVASNTGYLTASNSSNNWFGFTTMYSASASTNYIQWPIGSTPNYVGNNSIPFTWGASTYMRFNITYRTT